MDVYAVNENEMDDWKMICREWCEQNNAKLLFVNSSSFGCEFPDGSFRHIYIDELAEMLEAKVQGGKNGAKVI